jgi:hypothetical protein
MDGPGQSARRGDWPLGHASRTQSEWWYHGAGNSLAPKPDGRIAAMHMVELSEDSRTNVRESHGLHATGPLVII